jgi:UDP-glucuronate decarboxylase
MDKTQIEQDIQYISTALGREIIRLSGSTLLISGGAGFIGGYIVRCIDYFNKTRLKKPCMVICVDNLFTGTKKNIIRSKYIRYINADISKPLKISKKVDFIIHAAGVASPIYYRKFPLETIQATITGVTNLLLLAKEKKVKSFLFFSSSEIYGDPDQSHIPTPESYLGNVSCTGERACYDESKRLGETLCMVYYRLYGVPVKIVRPFNVYGPCMKMNDYRVIPTFLTQALQGRNIRVHGDGKQTRTFCYIADAVVAFIKVLVSRQNGEIYNVGNSVQEISIRSLATLIVRLLGYTSKLHMVKYPRSYPSHEPRRRCPDVSKITKKFDTVSRISLEEGLSRTLVWFKKEYSL